MSLICPTVLASSGEEFAAQMERVTSFASRIQIDLMDGIFAPTRSVTLAQVWMPDDVVTDIHLMYAHPAEHLEALVALNPHLVIMHAEADGDIAGAMAHLQRLGIGAGVALLKDTAPSAAEELITQADHVLLFSGDLGKFGGQADLKVLDKVAQVKAINPRVEIGWDGGAAADNIERLRAGGIDVINAGGAIQNADDPQAAYATLETLAQTA